MASSPRRLGFGEYEPELDPEKQDHFISRYTACFRFLEVVRMRYPHVLADLAEFPYKVPALQREGNAMQWVRNWAVRHQLRIDIVVRIAAWTLAEWARNPDARERREWDFSHVYWPVADTALQPLFPEPTTETRDEWRARCDELWAARVREMEAANYSRTKRVNPDHFDWLARIVVGRESRQAVAVSAGVKRQAVAAAVSALAELIQLQLPSRDRGGRPVRSV